MPVIWINGPFGGGKTTLAKGLMRELPGSVLFDPEEVGYLLRGVFPNKRDDFQDFPAWRTLVAECAIHVYEENDRRPVVAPMTLLNHDYAAEIHDRIRSAGTPLVHILLHAEPDTISARIEGSMEFPGDEERSEKVRVFRRKKAAVYADAHRLWLTSEAEVIDTTHLNPAQVAEQALKTIGEL
ncbi:AAA family ATPase [Kitasatospora sp. NPDC048296]|uniref:AAA family ATPase n=1 Tax=Kitasatospora sp. NPDC048296 TaxID=3364048 RepID=UPI0037173D16